MIKDKKLAEFLKGSSILVVANVILKSINFFLLPLYTKYLDPVELGISDLITTFTAFLFPLLVMGMDSAFSAFFYDEKDEDYQGKVFNTVWFTVFIPSCIPLILILLSNYISMGIFGSEEYKLLISIALTSVTINIWYLPFSLLLRMQNKMAAFGTINIIASLIMIGLNVLFLAGLRLSTYSLIASTLIAHIAQLILYVCVTKVKLSPEKIDNHLRKSMLKFALPLLPTVISAWVLNMSDRFIIKMFIGEDAVGIYGIAARFSGVLAIVSSAVYTAYSAFAFNKKDDPDASNQFKRVLNGFFFLLFGVCFTASLFGKEIVLIMTNQKYAASYFILPGILFGQLAYGVNTITSYGISFAKKTVYALISTSLGAITSVVLNLIFIPIFGLVSAGHINFISYALMCVLGYIFAQKVYPCDYGIVRIYSTSLIGYFLLMLFLEIQFIFKIVVLIVLIFLGCVLYRDVITDFYSLFKLAKNNSKQT